MGEGPVRTCIGCRRSAPTTELLRIVVDPGRRPETGETVVVVLDRRHRLPGRGAWLHEQPGCVDQALKRRTVGRALRLQPPLDLTAVQALGTVHDRSGTQQGV